MDLSRIGAWSDPVAATWTSRDARLYALGVGAGLADPSAELAYTTENSIGVAQVVLPTMAISIGGSVLPDIGNVDWTAVRIAGQSVRLHRPLPVSGGVRVRCQLAEVLDKGRGAIVRFRGDAYDLADGGLVFELGLTWFVQGLSAGGSSTSVSPAGTAWTRPARAPDRTVSCPTRPEQALLYRLSGHPNPIHSDPVFARGAGFDRPILQGPATIGMSGRALLNELCGGDAVRFGSIDARFSSTVYPGDTLTVRIWETDAGALFQTTLDDGTVVVDAGRFEYR